jgi:hypothetical protein
MWTHPETHTEDQSGECKLHHEDSKCQHCRAGGAAAKVPRDSLMCQSCFPSSLALAKRSNGLPGRRKFGSHDRRMFRPRVSHRPHDPGLMETSGKELVEECACILGTGDSGKPVCRAGLKLLG